MTTLELLHKLLRTIPQQEIDPDAVAAGLDVANCMIKAESVRVEITDEEWLKVKGGMRSKFITTAANDLTNHLTNSLFQ